VAVNDSVSSASTGFMNQRIRLQLFTMMVLQSFIWGTWMPLVSGYLPNLEFTPLQQTWVLDAFPIASIVGMFFSNQFADRNFAAEKFLAFSHLVGGLAIAGLAFTRSFWPFFILMTLHCLLYVPTMSICNSIAFTHMKDPQKEFGIVRMGGTIGWILAAWPFTFILVDWDKVRAANPEGTVAWLGAVFGSGLTGPALHSATRWTYIVGGVASLVMAAYSLTLPHTAPKKAGDPGTEKLAWLEAMKLLKHPFVLVLWIITLVDAFVLYCYFNWTGPFLGTATAAGGPGIPGNWIMPVMSIGQVMEILTMLVLGATLKRLGWRATMLVGILGHTARFAIYAFFPQSTTLIILVQLVHGICYAFFFATMYIFVDSHFPKDARTSAQGLFNMVVFGLGYIAANFVCPWLKSSVFTHDNVTDYRSLFLVPTCISIVTALALALLFHPPKLAAAEARGAAPAH
jgi:predicted MFS family arabinose efflux permease